MTAPEDKRQEALEGLETGVEGNAEKFGLKPAALSKKLAPIGDRYAVAKKKYQKSPTRGAVLNAIAEALEVGDSFFADALGKLESVALRAALGIYPNSGIRLQGGDAAPDVSVPERPDLEVSAIKKMAAAKARSGGPTLYNAEIRYPALSWLWSDDEQETRERLREFAHANLESSRILVREAYQQLEKTFQVEEGEGGRNQKVADGLISPADWRMMNEVMDLIWPIENGKLNPQRMEDVRRIVEQVVIFALGEKGAEGNKMKPKMKMKVKKTEKEKIEQSYSFSEAAFSMIMSLRHQINTLRRAVKFIEKRKMELNASDSMEEHHLRREERLDRVAFYPLLDWRRELERRLREADYRVWDKTVRRVTGGSLSFPEVPRYQKSLPQSMIALKLIHALKNHSSAMASGGEGAEKAA
jgi:hypothetical protein